MITIRLQRVGRKNDPSFRVIVVDSKKSPKTGNYLELVGSYDPRTDRIDLKSDRIVHWMKSGAQVSDTVHNLLVSQKVIDAKKRNVLPKKTVAKKEEPAPAEAPKVAAVPVETPLEAPAAAEEAPIAEESSAIPDEAIEPTPIL